MDTRPSVHYTEGEGGTRVNTIHHLMRALGYIEAHLTDKLSVDEIARQALAASSHFQLIFHVVTGLTVGEYIRNRRLSLAAMALVDLKRRVAEVAEAYGYESPESFSKAFTRFHGIPPSKATRSNVQIFHALRIAVQIEGGFDVSEKILDEFLLLHVDDKPDAEAYRALTRRALQARHRNPDVFDALTAWVRDDANWTAESLAENEWVFMQGVIAKFQAQNEKLRAFLRALEPSGAVPSAVFGALDRFDEVLAGRTGDAAVDAAVARVFADFSAMLDAETRRLIAGNMTGSTGTENQDFFGYVNALKDCDAAIQWTLFMPDLVGEQLKNTGVTLERFDYVTLPAMRFIGIEMGEDLALPDTKAGLAALSEYACGFDYDLIFMHHYGRGVDVEREHHFYGRFFRANAPMPEGFVHFDLLPDEQDTPYLTFRSQFALGRFSAETAEALYTEEGFDANAMYDVTRNIVLSENVIIPYPHTYWTADVPPESLPARVDGRVGAWFLFSVIKEG
jgi:AraC-like DNA-binding protein